MIARLIISSSISNTKDEVAKLLKLHLEGVRTNSHPDLLYFPTDAKLGIAEARKIKEHFSLKPYSSKGRAVVLEDASSLTPEAQNALLKTLEELPEHALFILCANSDAPFLPTVLSRCQIITLQPERLQAKPSFSADIEKLLESSMEQRFEYIEKLKDREEFFHCLLDYFHKKLPENSDFTKELLQTEQWQKQNVNIRAILEYLMLKMPSFDRKQTL